MRTFLETLKVRNEPLFYFGLVCLLLAVLFLVLSRTTTTQVLGVNAWIKPFKFAASIAIYSWTMAWYCHYLNQPVAVKWMSWCIVVLLGFEILYIGLQAARGQLSHFNISTPFYGFMYNLMALAASSVALITAYVAVLFFTKSFPELSDHYLWSIRIGLVLFVVFSFEGFVMGARLSHTIGGEDGGPGLPIVNWSTKYGDPRVAHFVGMHVLQVLPMMSFYLLKSTLLTVVAGLVFFGLAAFVLVQALQGKPLIGVK